MAAIGPCLPIYPRSDLITPLKDLWGYPSVDGVTILWKPEATIVPPNQQVLIRAYNQRTATMQQSTATIWRGDGVGYIDFIPDAKIGDIYDLYIRPHTDTIGGHWQHLVVDIDALTGPPQVVQSVVTRKNPHQVLVTFDRPVVVGSNANQQMTLTKNGVAVPVDHVETLPQYPHSTLLLGAHTPFYKGDIAQWVYNGGGSVVDTKGTEIATGVPYLIINNSKLEGRAFSDGFSLGFS